MLDETINSKIKVRALLLMSCCFDAVVSDEVEALEDIDYELCRFNARRTVRQMFRLHSFFVDIEWCKSTFSHPKFQVWHKLHRSKHIVDVVAQECWW